MTWPQSTDYNGAIQNPAICFRDEQLKLGEVAGDMFGLPRPHAGNFASVYQVTSPEGDNWAVKCFTREVQGLRERYEKISEHLKTNPRSFMVEFDYQEEGILVLGSWYPILKMRWVEGFTLNAFVQEHLGKRGVFDRLATMWVRLAQELSDANIAHGDLQHGNVLLVPKGANLALRLIDYDGMYVPLLADQPSAEKGHSHYQHPQRLDEGGYFREVDRFSHLVIYTTLRALHAAGTRLWDRYYNGDNLLFKEEDFRKPNKSKLLRELWTLNNYEVRALMGHVLLSSQVGQDQVPRLQDLLEGGLIRPLEPDDEKQVQTLMGVTKTVRKSQLALDSDANLPELPSNIGDAETSTDVPRAPVAKIVPSAPTTDNVPSAQPTGEGDLPSWIVSEPVSDKSDAQATPVAPTPTTIVKATYIPESEVPAVPAVKVVAVPVQVEPTPSKGVPRVKAVPVRETTVEERKETKQAKSAPGKQEPTTVEPKKAATKKKKTSTDPETKKPTSGTLILGIGLAVGALLCLLAGLWLLLREPIRPHASIQIEYRHPRLKPFGTLVLQAGEAQSIPISIDRQGIDSRLRILLEDLPEGVTKINGAMFVSSLNDEVILRLRANKFAPQAEGEILVQLWEGAEKVHQERLKYVIEAMPMPQFEEFDSQIVARIGQRTTLNFKVDRKGHTERLEVRIKPNEKPSSVSQQSFGTANPGNTVRFDLRVRADAIPEVKIVTLELLMNSSVLEGRSRPIALSLER